MNYSENKTKVKSKRLNSKSARTVRHIRLWVIRVVSVAFVVLVAFGVTKAKEYITQVFDETPDIRSMEIISTGKATRILSPQGETIQTLSADDINRIYVGIDQIPANLRNSILVLQESEGTSITEQLLNNQFDYKTNSKDTFSFFKNALKENYMTMKLEELYSGEEILEYYLNTATFGQNTLGVGAASERYFNKEVSSLTLSECAMLAGIVRNPTSYNPISYPSRCRNRVLQVLALMQEKEIISSDEYEEAIEDDVISRVQKYNRIFTDTQTQTSYYVDALLSSIIDNMKSELGYSETKAVNALYMDGLTVYCTIDTDMQTICDEEVSNSQNYPLSTLYQLNYQLTISHPDGTKVSYNFSDMKKWYADPSGEGADEIKPVDNLSQYFSSAKKAQEAISAFRRAVLNKEDTVIAESIELIPQPQISFVVIDNSTGAVRALVGGRDEGDETNRAIDITRQPGTALSLLSAYAPAIDTTGMTLGSIINDEEYYYPGTEEPVQDKYESYQGLCTLRKSIADGINVNAVKTLDQVTPKVGYDYLKNLGFSTLIDGYSTESGLTDSDIALPMALGSLRRGVSNIELSAAYAAIADGGRYRKPYFYTRILDADGEELLSKNEKSDKQVMKENSAWLLTDAIKITGQDDAPRYPGISFGESEMAIAGVSGESENASDSWFVGYTPYLTAGIWGGYDGGMSQTDTEYTVKIWNEIMRRIHDGYEVKSSFPAPGDILSATICTKCGKLAISGLCEDAYGGEAQSIEYYTPQTIPTETCDCHVRVRICKESGHLAGDACPEEDIYEVVYLQKKDESAGEGKTADSSLIMPDYLIDSICEVHGG